MKHALGSAGDPQKGLPQYQPIMPPTTKPTGPAVSKPVPAPKTAPTLSAREVVGPRAIIKIGIAASKVLRMVIPRKAKWEVEHKSPRHSTRQTDQGFFSVDRCGTATRYSTPPRPVPAKRNAVILVTPTAAVP